MKVYEIKVQHFNGESLDLFNFKRELETEINNDSDLLERVKQANLELAAKLKMFCENPENAIYAGTAVQKYLQEIPSFHYIKNIEHNGKQYDIEIDSLFRAANLIEI